MLRAPWSRSACLGGGGFLASCPPITAACRVMCASPPRRAFRRADGPAEPCLSKCAFRTPRRCPMPCGRHPFASLCATSTTTSTSRWDENAASCLIWRRYRPLAGRHAVWMSAPGPADRPQARAQGCLQMSWSLRWYSSQVSADWVLAVFRGGPYGTDKSALAWPVPCASLGPLKGSGPWTLRSTICSSARTVHDLAIAREPRWGAIRRRAARSLGESGRCAARIIN